MGKNKTIKGTNLTFVQRKLLEKDGHNARDYKFVKEIITQDDQSKRLNKTSTKTKSYQYINVNTGDLVEIPIMM